MEVKVVVHMEVGKEVEAKAVDARVVARVEGRVAATEATLGEGSCSNSRYNRYSVTMWLTAYTSQ